MNILQQVKVTLTKEPLRPQRIVSILKQIPHYVLTQIQDLILKIHILLITPSHKANDSVLTINTDVGTVQFYLPNPNDSLQARILTSHNFFEIDHLEFLKNYMDRNSVVADVGANIGNHAIYFSRVVGVNKVYSFEPIPDTYAILQKNIELNNLQSIVEIEQVAVAAPKYRSVSVSFKNPSDCGATQVEYSTTTDSLPCISLDEYFAEKETLPSVLKIDVEGFELEVLKGACNIISVARPIIFIEIWKDKPPVEQFLEQLGYSLACSCGGDDYLYLPNYQEQ